MKTVPALPKAWVRWYNARRWMSGSLVIGNHHRKLKPGPETLINDGDGKRQDDTSNHGFEALYNEAINVSRKKRSLLESRLYQTDKPSKSILDSLRINDWHQKPFDDAINDLPPEAQTVTSNILSFRCPNSLITARDFINAYPIKSHRKYHRATFNDDDIMVTKKRDATTLMFEGEYYLMFPNYNHAAVYWLETRNKSINGFPLTLNFIPITTTLNYLSSPHFTVVPDNIKIDRNFPFRASPTLNKLLTTIKHKSIDDNFQELSTFSSYKERQSFVLVKNVPFGLSKFALPRLLWDYEFPSNLNQQQCFRTILRDQTKQLHTIMIIFKDHENAKRFIRTFHGQRIPHHPSKSKIKRFYEPIYCEIVY